MTVFRCSAAWIEGVVSHHVDITTDAAGRISAVTPSDPNAQGEVITLPGVVLPGLANAHSHAFHRALRGRTHADGGTFWTWREGMYRVAARLDPDTYYALARATFGEMVLAGVTCVGEFHYVHHAQDGSPYSDPNAMGEALRHAARDAGLRLTLLDTCYLAGGLGPDGHLPLQPEQRRFSDITVEAWTERFGQLSDDASTRIGAAIHSVRAVPQALIPQVVEAARGRPLHAHVSEQVAEIDTCREVYGVTPVGLLHRHGALGPDSTAVHATHLTDGDIALLGGTRTSACFCPTTERDLADGIGPALTLRKAGVPLCLGSDQNAIIDLIEEARGLEMNERLLSHRRGRHQPAELIASLTEVGHRALGWDDAGRIAVGQRADLVAVRLDTVRTAGATPEQAVLAAFASDVDTVVVDGRVVVSGGAHRTVSVAEDLSTAIEALWRDDPAASS